MQDNHKKQQGSGAGAVTTRALTTGASTISGDATSAKLSRLGSVVGNDEIQQRLGQGGATREEMMAFIHSRLGTIRNVQLKEMEQMGHTEMRQSWKLISDSHKEDITKPDPKRWRASAALYEDAMYQICRGNIGRGAEIIERAVNEEQRAFGSLSSLVEVSDVEADTDAPECCTDTLPHEATGECAVPPEDAQLAREIQNVDKEVADSPNKKKKRDPWWTIDEEEDEEDDEAA
ncbi:MAG: hypothetical protein HN348_09740 [Proteobacteria bacterium]|nr:hypothetical protein [Pseudomonadota bacterium]